MDDNKNSWIGWVLFGAIVIFGLYRCVNPKEVWIDSVPSVLVGTWKSSDFITDRDIISITNTHISGDRIKRIKGPRQDIYGAYSLYVGGSFFFSCYLNTNGVLDISYVQEGEDRSGSPIYDYINMGSYTK